MAQSTARVSVLPALAAAALAACAAPPATDRAGATTGSATAAATASPQVEAGWMLLGETEGASLYIHPRSTLRVGSSAFIMVVAARHRPMLLPDGAEVGSLRERYEIDCAARRYRRHDGTAHPDRAALGPVLGRVGQDDWRGINPRTVMAAVSTAVCSAAAPPDGGDASPAEPAWKFPRSSTRIFRT
jgi:hypothetical protein